MEYRAYFKEATSCHKHDGAYRVDASPQFHLSEKIIPFLDKLYTSEEKAKVVTNVYTHKLFVLFALIPVKHVINREEQSRFGTF